MKHVVFLLVGLWITSGVQSQTLGVLKYSGGGDWYSNPTALKNLIQFCNKNIDTTLEPQPQVVHPEDPALFGYPFVHMTGHGNVVFSDEAIKNLKIYLMGGGFLHIDDNSRITTLI